MLSLCLAVASVVLQQGSTRTIEIWSDSPIAVSIEHLTIDDHGKAHVTNARRLSVGPAISLTYEPGERRYVRFSYEGVSPHTYSATELSALKRLRLPDALPGGELLLLVPPATVRPIALAIDGPRVNTVHPGDAQHVSLAGLPDGRYGVVPIYEGGIRGRARTYGVQTARTSLGAIRLEAVGAVRVIAARTVCDTATEVRIDMRLPVAAPDPDTPPPPHRAHILTSDEPRCDMTFAGLPPGTFQIWYANKQGTTGSGAFDVETQTVTDVRIEAPPVRVSGRVTLNGRPMPRVALRFFSLGGTERLGGAMKLTHTDGSGYFSVALESAGRYVISGLSDEGLLGRIDPATFVDGANAFDVALTGGTVSIELTGWDRRAPVNVTIAGPDGMQGTSLSPGDSNGRRTFFGLPFGTYKVSLGSARGQAQETVLTASRPDVTLTFDVSRR